MDEISGAGIAYDLSESMDWKSPGAEVFCRTQLRFLRIHDGVYYALLLPVKYPDEKNQ